MAAPVRVGETILAAEADYCYGTGTLHLSVTEVGAVDDRPDGQWINLVGVTLRPDGSVLDARTRPALVRVKGIRVVGRP